LDSNYCVNYQVSPSLYNPSNDAFSPPICNHGIDENAHKSCRASEGSVQTPLDLKDPRVVWKKKWERNASCGIVALAIGYGSVGGQWVDRASSAVEAMSAASSGRDSGCSKVHGTVSDRWDVSAAPTADAMASIAGDAATSNATATRETSFSFMSFPKRTDEAEE